MKFLLVLIIVCAGFVGETKAQMCGKFRIGVSVQNADGEPIDNAVIQFLPITTDETFGKSFVRDQMELSKLTIQFTEGQSVKNFHKLIVSANGYKTAENEIKFYSCRGSNIIVKLPKSDAAAAPVWEFSNSIMIETQDAGGKEISGVKLTVLQDGKIIGSKEIEYYGVGFDIPNGKYVLRLAKKGYQTREIKVDLTKIADVDVTAKLKLLK